MGLKEAYQDKLEAQLKEWTATLDQVKAKADAAEASARIEYYKQIDGARAQIAAAQAKLNELKASTEDAWASLKGGVEETWANLKTAVDGAVSKFK
ncbi:hypothetical protein [Nitrospira moscoviensis]|uniref:Coiled coil domain-containing protein n=1 Tax=Nitrospira moscoviensis TaxID=42253 RepID=A0A0K2GHF3_NITMO|nr:hypothetical protein [Nitrospira moscoviensis]ALA60284.1 hypothetical protein NITMOv2_3897 [Nitrospira moscoviensis]